MKKLLLLLTLCLIVLTGCGDKKEKEDAAALLIGIWTDKEADVRGFIKFNKDGQENNGWWIMERR